MNDAIPTPNPSAKRQADRIGSGGRSAEKADAAVKMKAREHQASLAPEEPREDPREQRTEDSARCQYRRVAFLVVNRKLVVLGQSIERVGDESLIQAEQQSAQSSNHAYDVDDGLISPRLCFHCPILTHAISLPVQCRALGPVNE